MGMDSSFVVSEPKSVELKAVGSLKGLQGYIRVQIGLEMRASNDAQKGQKATVPTID